MPIRTKDFMLFLLAIIFLLVGGVSWSQSGKGLDAQEANLIYGLQATSDEGVIYQATLPEAKPDERASRLQMRQGEIAQLFASDELSDAVVEEEKVPATEVVVSGNDNEIILCPNFSRSNIEWDSTKLKFIVTEGARILYREVSGQVSTDVSSSTVLQLPINSVQSNTKTCLKTDIVGIALDGSLMRNGEDKIYKIFGGETLLGYALDGFPIYGLNTEETDSCGGTSVLGAYRYYLSDKRAGLIGCFSGSPIEL